MRHAVRLVSISRGAEFVIDLSTFTEPEPLFAYVDDLDGSVEALRGSVIAGHITLYDQPPFMWLAGPRDCILLTPSAEGTEEGLLSFCSLSVGEFCLEIYHVRPDGSVVVLYRNDFCFK